jgi:Suppressor of fused protein (SUFU)
MRTDSLVQHLEAFLGPIAAGWAEDGSGQKLPFQIVRFDPREGESHVTFATLGLSRHILGSPSRETRQELVIAVQKEWVATEIVGLLVSLGELVVERHRALLRGEVLPPRGRIVPGSTLEGIYVSPPVFAPDDFTVFDGSKPPTIIAWMVPISRPEADAIDAHGWSWFEGRLAALQPDLFDLGRPSIVD